MGRTVTLSLDGETGAYLERLAADQGRTPAEVAAWIVTEELRRERAIDADLLARLDEAMGDRLGADANCWWNAASTTGTDIHSS